MPSGNSLSMMVLCIQKLIKRFGRVEALREIDLSAEEGMITGIIGPDGAGKTTLLRAVVGLLKPDGGIVEIWGHRTGEVPEEVKQSIGYVPQSFSLYVDLSVEENLDFFAKVFSVPPRKRQSIKEKLLELSNLKEFRNRRAGDLSGGMQEKLSLICALIHEPKLLVLDEPTTGIDPLARREIWEMLYDRKEVGVSVLLSTPYLVETEYCDQVVFLYRGKVIGKDRPERLKSLFPYEVSSITGVPLSGINLADMEEEFEKLRGCSDFRVQGGKIKLNIEKGAGEEASRLLREFAASKFGDEAKVREEPSSIEDLFTYLVFESEKSNGSI